MPGAMAWLPQIQVTEAFSLGSLPPLARQLWRPQGAEHCALSVFRKPHWDGLTAPTSQGRDVTIGRGRVPGHSTREEQNQGWKSSLDLKSRHGSSPP